MTPQEQVKLLEMQAKVKTDRIRGYYIKKRYGITLEQYNYQYEQQGGACRICGQVKNDLTIYCAPGVKTAAALLCNRCTLGIGYLNNNPKLILRVSQFVQYALDIDKKSSPAPTHENTAPTAQSS